MTKNNYYFNEKQRKQLLEKKIASAQDSLYDKLINIDTSLLNISEYNQRYLGNKIYSKLKNELLKYGRLLNFALKDFEIPLEKFVLVDYGGGIGVISFLASEMGIGTVIYNDIYDVSCEDVVNTSKSLGLKLDHIVCGDVDDLVSYIRSNSISVNALVSYDVIEHIYDVQSHFEKLRGICDDQLRIVYASGANIANPLIVQPLKKKQLEYEYKDREKKFGHKDRDSLKSYFDIRKSLITAYAPNLGREQIDKLALNTRGLIQQDIEKCVDEFLQHGYISYCPDHPTNTCDPYTGNWCEHLMDHEWLKMILRNQGYAIQIIPGFYGICDGNFMMRSAKIFLNTLMRLSEKNALLFANHYFVYANIFSE